MVATLASLLPAQTKWARFFRLQYAVRQTAKNRARAKAGCRQVGRPVARLVSLDTADMYAVPVSWQRHDAIMYAQRTSGGAAYYAAFMDGEYFSLVHDDVVQQCLDNGKLVVLPREGLARW